MVKSSDITLFRVDKNSSFELKKTVIDLREELDKHQKSIEPRLREISTYYPPANPNDWFEKLYDSDFIFLARVQSEIIGYIHISGADGWLENVFIKEPYRGQGLLKPFLNKAIRFIQKKGLLKKAIFLNVVVANKKAIRAYESMGFKPFGIQMILDL